MKNLLLILLVLFTSFSCNTQDEMPKGLENGTYIGYFGRSSPTEKYSAANVVLTLDNGNFTGSSAINYYPAICKGTYKIAGQEIEFSNGGAWTAQFDWSYILEGKFKLEADGEKLRMSRGYAGTVSDIYVLTKKQEPK